jgi:hypothetical protein
MIAEIHVLGVLVVVALLAVAFFVGCMYADRRRDRELGVVTIERWGQATPRPKVSVSAQGRRGSQGVYTYDATEQGEACATLYGRGLAEILGVRLIDTREAPCDAPTEAP